MLNKYRKFMVHIGSTGRAVVSLLMLVVIQFIANLFSHDPFDWWNILFFGMLVAIITIVVKFKFSLLKTFLFFLAVVFGTMTLYSTFTHHQLPDLLHLLLFLLLSVAFAPIMLAVSEIVRTPMSKHNEEPSEGK